MYNNKTRFYFAFSTKNIFTLIELMIVISIIAILMTMLLPALNKARKQAKKTCCANNMKQLGVVFAFYGEDNNSYLPHVYNVPGIYSDLWYVRLAPYLPPKDVAIISMTNLNVMTSSILQCPECFLAANLKTNYIPNGNFFNHPALQNKSLKVIKSSGETALLTEAGAIGGPGAVENISAQVPFFNYPARVQSGNQFACISYPHMMSLNILFADGHATSQKRPKIGGYLDIGMDTTNNMSGVMYK